MKKIILLSALAALAFTSCEKDLYNPDLAKETVKDLVVPQDFDWEMTQTVTANLTATVETPVQVYTNEKCTDEFSVADITVFPDFAMNFSLVLPKAQESLFVKYSDGTVKEITINNQIVELTLEPISRATTRGWGNGSNEFYRYIGNNWSTIMFEDLFPNLGDYDFNDFVANYQYAGVYVVSGNGKDSNSSHIIGYAFEFRVNANGATLPTTPYLRVTPGSGMESFFDEAIEIQREDDNLDVTIVKVPSAAGEHIYRFDGFTNKPAGITYVNTLENQTLTAPKTIKFIVALVKNQGWKLADYPGFGATSFNFDFFITNGTDEIHKKGFEPTGVVRAYPADEIEGGANAEFKYSNTDNMIWALDVPALIDHAIEKVDFRQAFPSFATWATSGGLNEQEWYYFPNTSKQINYSGAFETPN